MRACVSDRFPHIPSGCRQCLTRSASARSRAQRPAAAAPPDEGDEFAAFHRKTLLLAARNGAAKNKDITSNAKATTAIASGPFAAAPRAGRDLSRLQRLRAQIKVRDFLRSLGFGAGPVIG